MHNYLRVGAVAVIAASVTLGSAHATIIGGSVTGGSAQTAGGTFQKLTLPFDPPNGALNTVGNNTFQTPNLYGFDEDQNILLAADLSIDGGGSISSGTVVASHYIFFDPGPTQSITGTITFDSEILGIASSTGLMAASDFLANSGVTYLNPTLRGLESGDTYSLVDAFTLAISWTASTPGDYIRVLTATSPGAEVPLPAAAPLFLSALLAGGWASRKKKRAA